LATGDIALQSHQLLFIWAIFTTDKDWWCPYGKLQRND